MDLGRTFRRLTEEHFKVLHVLDSMLERYSYVPIEIIERRTKIPPKKLFRALNDLINIRSIIKGNIGQNGYRLTYKGLDLLAIYVLTHKGIISYIGPPLGFGKESDLYYARTSSNRDVVIKFYRIGRTSFQKVSRVRDYLVNESNWLIRSKIAAEREYRALRELSGYTLYVPNVYGWSKHALVMQRIKGVELQKYRYARDPIKILKRILEVIKIAYLKVGIVHGDLSEYNIVIDISDDETPYVIDWPQYVYISDPKHAKALNKDIDRLLSFFRRRYEVIISSEVVLKYVKGEMNEL